MINIKKMIDVKNWMFRKNKRFAVSSTGDLISMRDDALVILEYRNRVAKRIHLYTFKEKEYKSFDAKNYDIASFFEECEKNKDATII